MFQLPSDHRSPVQLRQSRSTLSAIARRRIAQVVLGERRTSRERQMVGASRQHGAGGQPHEVLCVGQHTGFIEIVYSPDEAPFGVAPGAEGLEMEIPDRTNVRRVGEIRTHDRVALRMFMKE